MPHLAHSLTVLLISSLSLTKTRFSQRESILCLVYFDYYEDNEGFFTLLAAAVLQDFKVLLHEDFSMAYFLPFLLIFAPLAPAACALNISSSFLSCLVLLLPLLETSHFPSVIETETPARYFNPFFGNFSKTNQSIKC